MNMFIPQSEPTQIELEEISDVKFQLITPATSKSIIGIVQDGLVGGYTLTEENMRVDWRTVMNLLAYTTNEDFTIIKKDREYTGREIYSVIIPDQINVKKFDAGKALLLIENGIIKDGRLDSSALGAKKKDNLTQLILDQYGSDDAKDFLDNTQRLINNFNLYNTFSVGIGDIKIKEDVAKQLAINFETKKLEVNHLITEMENNPDLMDADLLERTLFDLMNVIREDVSKLLMDNLDADNGFKIMFKSGSKGAPINVGQMGGCTGQQAIEGKRMPKRMTNRTLPYFFQDDDSAMARGFIERPYLTGLRWGEFVFHNMTSREGLIDSAIKSVTPETPLIILEDGKAKYVTIGEWVDRKLDARPNEVKHYKEQDMELLNVSNNIFIPTVDESGNVSWGEITAVTRHDPGKELYEIKTHGGRQVIVTESKSLLIWNSEIRKFNEMPTADVKVGHFVPVTMSLATPPVINDSIDMMQYFKPNEIQDKSIPNIFKLDRDSGIFLGIFLALGSISRQGPNSYQRDSYDIMIDAGTNTEIRQFVLNWFDTHSVKSQRDRPITQYIFGHNELLGKFLDKKTSKRHKYIPNDVFTANEDFIIGLLNGLISSNSAISKKSVKIVSKSRKLIDGINMLCSRLGIFARVTKHFLEIEGPWIKVLSDKIELINTKKNIQLKNIKCDETDFQVEQDVVLDKIIEINKVDVKKYPKVYDLTIPSTLNFGLANGLHVVDTAESGYVQRKLIKSMEDAMVKYDGTVRTGTNVIVQYVYGDSGVDTVKQREHVIKLVELDDDALDTMYKFGNNESQYYDSKTYDNDKFVKDITFMRDMLRQTQTRSKINYMMSDAKIMLPVNLRRVLDNAKRLKTESKDKLQADYIYKKLNEILEPVNTRLIPMSKTDENDPTSIKYRDDQTVKTIFKIALYDYFAPKRILSEYKLNKAQFDSLVDDIISSFKKALAEPGEMVGTIAAQSIGEPVTQMTLNSIDWTDKIIIRENGNIKTIEIGKYIDEEMNKNNKTQSLGDNLKNEMGGTFYLDIKEQDVFAPSVDEDGIVSWNQITALTKHLPINTDGTNTLVKITTRMGRTVMATKAKSFLTRKDNKLTPTRGDEIKVGDYLPLMTKIPETKYNDYHDMTQYFPKTEYIYGSEVEKARKVRDDIRALGKAKASWFTGFNGNKYTVPYGRADSLAVALDGGIKQTYKENCIYTKKSIAVTAEFPERLLLDELSGYFFGAYCAEGCVSDTYVAIANNDKIYRDKIEEFCKRLKIGTHIQLQNDKIQVGWTSTDIRIHNVMLARWLPLVCGKLSHNKMVPEFAYTANSEFVKGFISGYIDGDGCVSKKEVQISASSVSEKLIDGIMLLLTRFDIVCKKGKPIKQTTNNRGSLNIMQNWTLTIRNDYVHKFANTFKLIIDYKQNRLNEIISSNVYNINSRCDKIPGNNLSALNFLKVIKNRDLTSTQKEDVNNNIIQRNDLREIYEKYNSKFNKAELDTINKALNSNIYYDEIITIEEVQPTKKYVYDLTVEKDKTFILANQLACYDTFHFSGIAAMGATNLGVPRIKELLSFSKNIKTPQMYIYLTEEYMGNKAMANRIASYMKYTTIEQIRKKIDVYYDPTPHVKGGYLEKDNVKSTFYSLSQSKNSCQSDITKLPWLMRIEFDREKMLNKEVTLMDIKSKFCNDWERRYHDIKSLRKEERILLEKITQCAVLSNSDNDKVPIIHLRFDMTEVSINTMVEFMDTKVDNFKIKGVESITDVFPVQEERMISYNNPTHAIDNKTTHTIWTAGINLLNIRSLNGIDLTKTICNDIISVYETFGIEATRVILLREFMLVFERSGSSVNYQHLLLLVDVMTNNGDITSIDRHGMNRMDNDPLSRASFEKTVDQLLAAAVFNKSDSMNSVSSRIMAGMTIKGGTGYCNLILDTKMLENSEYTEDTGIQFGKTYNELTSDNIIDDMIHKENDEGIFMPM